MSVGDAFLTAEDERDLLVRAKAGDQSALARLVSAFQPLTLARAAKAGQRTGLDKEDLAQDASIEILEAIRRFDPGQGCRFSTFLDSRFRGVFTAADRNNHRVQCTVSWWQSDADWFKNDRRMLKTLVPLSHAVSAYWPLAAILFVKQLRRRNDRLIAKGLWLDAPPRRPADIAKRLGISRSAVSQRRDRLIEQMTRKFGNLHFSQYVRRKSLNSYGDSAICGEDGYDE